jgi:hypothetical protein
MIEATFRVLEPSSKGNPRKPPVELAAVEPWTKVTGAS